VQKTGSIRSIDRKKAENGRWILENGRAAYIRATDK